jgi:FK506-binding protein 4/5
MLKLLTKQKGEYAFALKKYNKILDYLEHEVYDTEERKSKSRQLQLAARLNIQMCHLKLKDYVRAIEACNKALELEPRNEKSLFRMGQAHQGLGDFNDAIRCFNQVIEVNPENKDATSSISVCHQKIKEYNQKEKQMYGKMFSALSK